VSTVEDHGRAHGRLGDLLALIRSIRRQMSSAAAPLPRSDPPILARWSTVDGDTLTKIALGAALTLAVQFVIERFRQDRSDRKDEQAFRRQWRHDLVDLVADSRAAISDLSWMLMVGNTSKDDTPVDFARETWHGQTGLYRRLQRVAVGHPDAHVRQAASEISSSLDAMVKVSTAVQYYTFVSPGTKPREVVDDATRRELHEEVSRSVDELVSCIHGADVAQPVLEQPRAVALYERIRDRLPMYKIRGGKDDRQQH
jgi:hypothetical protein